MALLFAYGAPVYKGNQGFKSWENNLNLVEIVWIVVLLNNDNFDGIKKANETLHDLTMNSWL